MAHNGFYFGIDRTLRELDDFCIPRLKKRLEDYILRCLVCLLNRTSRERLYSELQPIKTISTLYYMIAMDFIMALLIIPVVTPWKIDGYNFFDYIIIQSCKASKKSLLIPGYSIYTAENWAIICVTLWLLLDWGIPRGIISNRDRKFVSSFWTGVFRYLTSLLIEVCVFSDVFRPYKTKVAYFTL